MPGFLIFPLYTHHMGREAKKEKNNMLCNENKSAHPYQNVAVLIAVVDLPSSNRLNANNQAISVV